MELKCDVQTHIAFVLSQTFLLFAGVCPTFEASCRVDEGISNVLQPCSHCKYFKRIRQHSRNQKWRCLPLQVLKGKFCVDCVERPNKNSSDLGDQMVFMKSWGDSCSWVSETKHWSLYEIWDITGRKGCQFTILLDLNCRHLQQLQARS